MTETELLTNKITTYLQGLSPQAVENLVRKLEKSRDSGLKDPHLELILAASLKLLRNPDDAAAEVSRGGILRRNQVQRMFFTPLEEFLINENLPNRQEGRVYRPNLDRVWQWIGRDVLPGDVRRVLEEAEKETVSEERLDNFVHALRRRAVDAVGSALERVDQSDKDRRRLSIEMGGERGIADLKDIHKILAAERWLMPFLNMVPETLSENRIKVDTDVFNLVDKCSAKYPDHISVVAAALLERADTPSALCTFAGRLARTNDPKLISSSQFAPFVDVVMSEAERLNVLALEHRNHNPDPVAFSQALSEYHSLVRGVELDMDLSQTGDWHKRLSGTKRNISEVVTRELNNAHGAVRRALQVPKWSKDGTLDQDKVSIDDAVRSLRVVVMVRNASQTFAVNDVGKRTRQAVEQTLEIVTRSLITDLGKTVGKQREAHLSAVDVAIMLSEIYFGADYAAQLRRSRQSALARMPKDDGMASLRKPRLITAGGGAQ
ncbi:hypothetical protein [Roseibium aggregatum]|uniref:hypothetical protein n=1 Tax=Roseibium aggregatum TaxID=187304 RepID=UPI001680BCBC|nr:hypothetical protein [Roseibium aggregatum]